MMLWLWGRILRGLAPLAIIAGVLLGLRVKWGREGAQRQQQREREADAFRAEQIRERAAQAARDADGISSGDDADDRLRANGRLRD